MTKSMTFVRTMLLIGQCYGFSKFYLAAKSFTKPNLIIDNSISYRPNPAKSNTNRKFKKGE